MVLTNCWQCLRLSPRLLNTPANRIILPRPSPLQPRSAPFTTTSSLLANPTKKQNSGQGHQKAIIAKQKTSTNKYHHKKKKRDIVATKQLFDIGERKLIRKNIVLSNTSAPALPLPEMMLDICGREETEGTVFQIPDSVLDSLKALGAFKTGQHWPYFQRPSTLMRKGGVEIGKLISWVNGINEGEVVEKEEAKGEERYARRILDGTKGSGRSILLAQAMNWAVQSGWVVISIPNAQDLVISHTEYEFDPAWGLWVQKEYTAALLGNILKANSAVIRGLELAETHKIGKEEMKPPTLGKLVSMGVQDPQVSNDVFMALVKELSMPGRPPVLFTLDNLGQISLRSAYRDAAFNYIHAHDLALPNTFLSYLSGASRFPRGLTLAATSSVCGKTKDLSNALRGIEPGPWDKVDARIAASVKGAEVIELEKLSRVEVKAIMEWYNAGGMLKQLVTIESVTEQYAISSGNPRELFQNCLRLKY